MKKLPMLIAPLALLLAARPVVAEVPPSESCCACLWNDRAQTAGPVSGPLEPVRFCQLVTGPEEQQAFDARCPGIGICIASYATAEFQDNLDCAALLAEAGYACPRGKAVPAAGQPLVIGLVAGLAAVGVWAARRRGHG